MLDVLWEPSRRQKIKPESCMIQIYKKKFTDTIFFKKKTTNSTIINHYGTGDTKNKNILFSLERKYIHNKEDVCVLNLQIDEM
jgi:hypothetical protein